METTLQETLGTQTHIENRGEESPKQEPRINFDMRVGQVARQGDVYVTRISDSTLPKLVGYVREHTAVKSHKIVAVREAVAVYAKDSNPLTLCFVQADDPWRLVHEKHHAPHHFGPGTYRLSCQLDAGMAKERLISTIQNRLSPKLLEKYKSKIMSAIAAPVETGQDWYTAKMSAADRAYKEIKQKENLEAANAKKKEEEEAAKQKRVQSYE